MRAFLWASNYQGKLSLQLVNNVCFCTLLLKMGSKPWRRIAWTYWVFRCLDVSVSILDQMTLNHRVPGSSPGAPTTQSLGWGPCRNSRIYGAGVRAFARPARLQ